MSSDGELEYTQEELDERDRLTTALYEACRQGDLSRLKKLTENEYLDKIFTEDRGTEWSQGTVDELIYQTGDFECFKFLLKTFHEKRSEDFHYANYDYSFITQAIYANNVNKLRILLSDDIVSSVDDPTTYCTIADAVYKSIKNGNFKIAGIMLSGRTCERIKWVDITTTMYLDLLFRKEFEESYQDTIGTFLRKKLRFARKKQIIKPV
jgi:hypothetical protein